MDDQQKDIMEKLILDGALQVSGIDSDTGEFLYNFTPKLKEVSPDLYNEHINHVNGELMKLWEKGFINIDFMSDNPIVTLSEKSFNQEEISQLSKEDKWSLEEIKRLLKSQEL